MHTSEYSEFQRYIFKFWNDLCAQLSYIYHLFFCLCIGQDIDVFIPLIQLKGCVDHMSSQYLSEYIDQSIPTAIGWIE